MKHRVAVVIVNWNGFDNTRLCLRSIAKLEKKDATLTTIVVDNGSTDGSPDHIRKEFASVVVIPLTSNKGFTGGNNVGISYALEHGADSVWLLNNDTIVDSHALVLADAVGKESIGIAGSKIYFAPGYEFHRDRYLTGQRGKVIWYAGGLIDWANMYASHRGVDEVDVGQYDTPCQTDFVTGCSMMVRREVFEKIGLLDDRYYLYLEDVDFCLRAQRAGFGLMYNPMSVVWHRNAGSSGGAGSSLHDYYLMRNRFLLGFGYASARTKFALLRQAVVLTLRGNSKNRKAVIDVLFGRYGKQYEPTYTQS